MVVRTEIDYRRAAKLGDRLVVEGWLDQLERVRFWRAFRIVRPDDDALIAECRQTLAFYRNASGKVITGAGGVEETSRTSSRWSNRVNYYRDH